MRADHTLRGLIAALAVFVTLTTGAVAEVFTPAAQRGLTLVRANCASCHSVDKVGNSPLTIAPPFRALHVKYPVESLRRPLTEGIMVNHPTMPVFRFDRAQVEDVIAYLKTLEK